MISQDEFAAILQRSGVYSPSDAVLLEMRWPEASAAASSALAAMPGIGMLSVTLRMNAFLAVCRHLDSMVDRSEVSSEGAALALEIMRLSDKAFLKAITMFDGRGRRLSADARADLPLVARRYLDGLDSTEG